MRVAIAVLLILIPGCKQVFGIDDPARVRPDAAVDAAIACKSDNECPATASHCVIAQGVCAECLVAAHCTDPEATLCDLDTRTCRGCLEHADCASRACLPDGTCGDDSTVAFVDGAAGNDLTTCTIAAPCATPNRAHALLTPTRRYVKLSGTITLASRLQLSLVADTVWLADPGTSITSDDEPIVELRDGNLVVYDLEVACMRDRGFRINGGTSLHLHGVFIHSCTKLAIEGNGGALVIDRSELSSNAGGIQTGPGTFSITNSFFTRNGTNGAVRIESSTIGINRFEFNTVVDNMASTSSLSARTGGIECPGSNTMAMPHNIIARNTGYRTNTFGGCDFSKSLVTGEVTSIGFVSSDTAPFDYHIRPPSVAIDAAYATTLAVDFDGQPRPVGVESDLGADEHTP